MRVFSKWQKCGGILCCFVWGRWDGPPYLILNIFTMWTKWATTPNVRVIYPNSMIYLPVQFYALCPVLSGVILIFNTKCLIMPNTTLQCLRTVTLNDICSDLTCLQSQWFSADILWKLPGNGQMRCPFSVSRRFMKASMRVFPFSNFKSWLLQ